MNSVQIGQKSYEMPPREGFTVAYFLTVADIGRSARFYETVFGGRILSGGDSNGAPGYIQIANIWLIVNVGGGPTSRNSRMVNARPGWDADLNAYGWWRQSYRSIKPRGPGSKETPEPARLVTYTVPHFGNATHN
jgi:hypothetical protein